MRLRLINERSIGGQFETLEYDSEEYSDDSEAGPGKAKNGISLEFVEIEMVSRV
jgi:hypothetical protein